MPVSREICLKEVNNCPLESDTPHTSQSLISAFMIAHDIKVRLRKSFADEPLYHSEGIFMVPPSISLNFIKVLDIYARYPAY